MAAKEKLLEFIKGLTDKEVEKVWEELNKDETERRKDFGNSH